VARLIDTSIIVAMQRQGIALSVVAAALSGEAIGIASITASELLVGVHKADSARQRQQRSEFVENVLDSFPVVGFDLEMARTHARISFELAAVGQSIGSHDLIIAATALTIGYGVMTHNIRHFERIPQLEVSGPSW
jgi:tRNA(fMet)-specific endonuclease VapC